jgi:hypothetical protein
MKKSVTTGETFGTHHHPSHVVRPPQKAPDVCGIWVRQSRCTAESFGISDFHPRHVNPPLVLAAAHDGVPVRTHAFPSQPSTPHLNRTRDKPAQPCTKATPRQPSRAAACTWHRAQQWHSSRATPMLQCVVLQYHDQGSDELTQCHLPNLHSAVTCGPRRVVSTRAWRRQ